MPRAMKRMAGGWSIKPVFQWIEWVSGGWTWRNFDFADVSIEAGHTMSRYFELHFVVLGVGVYIDWHHAGDLKAARDEFERSYSVDEDGTPMIDGERCVRLDFDREDE